METPRAVDFDLELTGFDWKAPEDLMPAEGAQATASTRASLTNGKARAMPGVQTRIQRVRRSKPWRL